MSWSSPILTLPGPFRFADSVDKPNVFQNRVIRELINSELSQLAQEALKTVADSFPALDLVELAKSVDIQLFPGVAIS